MKKTIIRLIGLMALGIICFNIGGLMAKGTIWILECLGIKDNFYRFLDAIALF